MKLIISEKIRECRTMLGITQEQLAKSLGISSQSVSKWECGDGYPDITMLPTIANFFGITIDELLQETGEVCNEAIQKATDLPAEEAINFLFEYHKKYPKNYDIMHNIIWKFNHLSEKEKANYAFRVKEICLQTLNGCTNIFYIEEAFCRLLSVCDDDEFQKYASEQGRYFHRKRYAICEEREWLKKDHALSRTYCDIDRLCAMVDYFTHSIRYICAPERCVEINESKLRLIEYFGGGTVPKGWLCVYTKCKRSLAAALFGCGRKEDGYRTLEEAIALEEEWQKIPKGALLPMGDEGLFGKICLEKETWKLAADGKRYANIAFSLSIIMSTYDAMTRKTGWEWFNSVRNEPRFLELLEKAEKLYKAREE